MYQSSPRSSEPHTPLDMVQLLTLVENMRQQNESLEEIVHTLQQPQSTKKYEAGRNFLILSLFHR